MANMGIDHISHRNGGQAMCKNRLAHMSISIERWRADKGGIHHRFCKRCEAKAIRCDAGTKRGEGA